MNKGFKSLLKESQQTQNILSRNAALVYVSLILRSFKI